MSMDPQTMQAYMALAQAGQPRQAQGPASGAAAGGTQLLQALMLAKRMKAVRDAQNGVQPTPGGAPGMGQALTQGPAPGPFPGPGNYDPSQGAANAANVS